MFRKAYSLTFSTYSPRYTVSRLVQPSKTYRSIFRTPLTNTTSRRLVQPENSASGRFSMGA